MTIAARLFSPMSKINNLFSCSSFNPNNSAASFEKPNYPVRCIVILALLEKFNGCQPDYRLNKAPIRYWDNYWFGKTRSSVYGDTMPHPALAHSAHCFYSYGVITNDKRWINYADASFRCGLCLFNEKGEAFSSYVYPERVNGDKGAFFDKFADEQDGFLYLAYKLSEEL